MRARRDRWWGGRSGLRRGFFGAGAAPCRILDGQQRCVKLAWPFAWNASARALYTFDFWHGTLTENKRDKAQTLYRRNRAYDPATGRFTQEDPIGLAGGLNLYGFANGDPVNFSDPFGLCPPCWQGYPYKLFELGARSSVGVSASLLNSTWSVSDLAKPEVAPSVILGMPQVGASVDFTTSEEPPPGSTTGSIDVGYGEHLGVSILVAKADNERLHVFGVTVHIGTPSSSLPIQATLDVPKKQSVDTGSGFGCAKANIGCPGKQK